MAPGGSIAPIGPRVTIVPGGQTRPAENASPQPPKAATPPAQNPPDPKIEQLREQAIREELKIKDLNKNLTWEQAKKMGFSREGFLFFSSGGVEGGGADDVITPAELKAAMAVLVQQDTIKALTGNSKTPHAIALQIVKDFKTCKSIRWVACEVAAKEYADRYSSNFEGGKLKLDQWLNNDCNESIRGTARTIAERLNGGTIDGKTRFTVEQFTSLLYALAFAAHAADPSKYGLPDAAKGGKPEEDNLLAWVSKEGKKTAEAGETSAAGEGAGGSVSQGKLQEAQEKYNRGDIQGTIDALESYKRSDQNNLRVRDLLVKCYLDKKRYEEALKDVIFAYRKDPTEDRKRSIFISAGQWANESVNKHLTKEQRELAAEVQGLLKTIADNASESDELKSKIVALAAMYGSLKQEGLPGEIDFQKIVSDKEKDLLEKKQAYDNYVVVLKKEISTLSDKPNRNEEENLKLARMRAKLAELSYAKMDFNATQENMVAALELAIGLKDEAVKDLLLKQAKFLIIQLYEFKSRGNQERDSRRLTVAKAIFDAYRQVKSEEEIEIDLDKNDNKITVKYSDVAATKGKVSTDYDDIQANIGFLGVAVGQTATITKDDKQVTNPLYMSSERKQNLAMQILCSLEKNKDNKNFFRTMQQWGASVSVKLKKSLRNTPVDPKGKFEDFKSAADFIRLLSEK
ncbi:hypothetical protein A2276_07885 [candidate division WOR-1 bacterium RIFOXYA12_FULL_43_27]|uniref:Uncharacterized protein n=1 Tax=candidate division WOR-1 bacterium RIFOXYC2_FULL_46_14 TaxID=1802587 RepID=A0A1F4U631_UNCSA|nr:MAG: hypothetical protein A2276_07885 [candidate division WOR-1 bacterium RIFOXYA12_FULL_43_27]OGC20517.1 MAG: hypothetical protein A2292_05710 [candidate division WOR-1 bacterium RIFOXYB2_FULL_46_45]OGC31746.1 MAG: hypothetical protein A2232_05740 [candidate division WOR-1 bacterium RIFOXYA2_FULL_46_56]OGC40361.1 MAG: hypothetical protein A2438_03730 [candidate division WOR-1 bacterium RIFOXYC2_FULL_46_14]